jgi:hypothetical protein
MNARETMAKSHLEEKKSGLLVRSVLKATAKKKTARSAITAEVIIRWKNRRWDCTCRLFMFPKNAALNPRGSRQIAEGERSP